MLLLYVSLLSLVWRLLLLPSLLEICPPGVLSLGVEFGDADADANAIDDSTVPTESGLPRLRLCPYRRHSLCHRLTIMSLTGCM